MHRTWSEQEMFIGNISVSISCINFIHSLIYGEHFSYVA